MSSRLLLALAFVVALSAGCGSASTLSPRQYRTDADALCRQQQAQLDRLGSPASASQLTAFLEQGTALTERALARYAALKPPQELARDHQAAVALRRSELDALRRLAADIKRSPGEAKATLAQSQAGLSALDAQLKARYKALGLRDCGRG